MSLPHETDDLPLYTLEQVVAVIRHLCDVACVPERERVLLQRALAEMTALELSSVLQGAGVTHRGLALGLLADLLTVHVVHARPEAARARSGRLAPDDDYGRRCAEGEEWGRKRAAALWLAWAAREGSGRASGGAVYATAFGPFAPEAWRAWAGALRAACESPDRAVLDRMLAHEEEAIPLAAADPEAMRRVLEDAELRGALREALGVEEREGGAEGAVGGVG